MIDRYRLTSEQKARGLTVLLKTVPEAHDLGDPMGLVEGIVAEALRSPTDLEERPFMRDVLNAVATERRRQDHMFGGDSIAGMTPTLGVIKLAEETGEVARAVWRWQPGARVVEEAVQAAAVAVAIAEAVLAGLYNPSRSEAGRVKEDGQVVLEDLIEEPDDE